jgi:hypothetical protein
VSAEPTARPPGRVRRAREPVARHVIQKVKLTEEERDRLRARAAELGVSVPRLLVESALGEHGAETATERRREMAELFEVRRLLATVANNVNQQARAANVTGEVAAEERLAAMLGEIEAVLARLRALTGARR